jgi:hypothetical protein
LSATRTSGVGATAIRSRAGWALAVAASPKCRERAQGTEVVPPRLSWTPDGRFAYVKFSGSTFAIPLQTGEMLPPVPAQGFPSTGAVAALPGARLVSEESVFPGPNPLIYTFTRVATQRNIYRVSCAAQLCH